MNEISKRAWDKYVSLLRSVDDRAEAELNTWIDIYGTQKGITDLMQIRDLDGNNIIDAAYILAQKYGNASASLAAQMYDLIAEMSGANVPPAELEDNPTFGEIAKTVQGTLKTSQNPEEVSSAVSRMVKRTGTRTTLKNVRRDGAQYAWIPSGDTCAWCIMLAGHGWQYDRSGQPDHIHSNCDCTYAVRFNSKTTYAGYDPEKYAQQYRDADGSTREEKLNSMRRKYYAENKAVILAQKAAAYAKRQELNSSEAEETNVN